jgi:hypothetical protein
MMMPAANIGSEVETKASRLAANHPITSSLPHHTTLLLRRSRAGIVKDTLRGFAVLERAPPRKTPRPPK